MTPTTIKLNFHILPALALALALTTLTTGALAQTKAVPVDSEPDLSDFLSTFYTDGGGGGPSKNNTPTSFVQSIAVSAPAYCSNIKGDVTVTFKAPGMTTVHPLCWQQPTADNPSPWGHDMDLAPGLQLDADGNGSFVFHADQFPNGPIMLRLYAKDSGAKQDICELQLFNQGGAVWNQGAPKTDPPAAQGMKVAFVDDFDGPLSIAGDTSARYWTHWGGGDGSQWPFNDNTGPLNPFSQVGTWLRIHASKPEGTPGATGNIASVHKNNTGITVTAPCYFECRFLAQDVPGIWPAFWVTTQPSPAQPTLTGCDEMDVIEAYGTSANCHGGLWSGYHNTTHYWGQPTPAWLKQNGPDGKPYALGVLTDTMPLAGKSSWSTTFHTYGLLITKTDTVYYFDDVEVHRHPTGKLAGNLPMGFLVNLALGGGWPVDLKRYGNQSDMWVDYVRLYQGQDQGGLDQSTQN